MFKIMELKFFFIPLLIVQEISTSAPTFSTDAISRLFSEAKAEIAKSFFKRELSAKEMSEIINVTHESIGEVNVTNSGENGRIFRSANENFVFDGVQVLQLQKNGTAHGRYTLSAADDVRLDEGAVFFKNAEWNNKLFLAICYQKGYCEIRMSTASLKINLKMKINTGTLPLDVNFFGTDTDFFLITVQDPVTIYRWTGTYFNEDFHLDTTGAQSVAAFQDGGKAIIVVAQNLRRNKVYSKVYVWKDDEIELFQLLPTTNALRVLPFNLTNGEDVLHFVFVLSDVQSSSVFWWTGKEFVLWKSLENIIGQHIVYVGEIGSETFFFISDENKVYIYHPTVTNFDLMQIITFDQEVVGIDLRQEKDRLPMLVLLTGSVLDPYFKVNLILLQINRKPGSEKEKNSNGILECLSNLKEKLKGRKQEIMKVSKKMFEKENSSAVPAEDLKIIPLEISIREVNEKLEEIQRRLDSVRNDTQKGRNFRYHVHGDLKIERMIADGIHVEVLNGKPVEFENFLSLTKDQTITGYVDLLTLSADDLTVSSVNGIEPKDLLVRNAGVQRISGDYTLASLSSNDVKFGAEGSINEIPFSEIQRPKNNDPGTGINIFPKLKVKHIEADNINNVPTEKWLSKILPTLNGETEEPLNFTNLTIEKLWVSNLNGIPWDDFVKSFYLPLNNEAIKGNLTVKGTTKVRNLKTNKINGVPIPTTTARSSIICQRKTPEKAPKFLPANVSPVWDDSFLKEILNEPEFSLSDDDDLKYFSGTKKFEGDLRATSVFVKNSIEVSGFSVGNLETFKERFWLKSQDQIITTPVDFANGFSVASLQADNVNNKSLNSFIWTDSINSISSSLVFENAEVLGDVTLAEDAVQNVNLKNLNATSAKSTGENLISGLKWFLGNVTVKNLNVDVLNGVEFKDLMDGMKNNLIDSDTIEIPELIVYGNLVVKDGIEVKMINGADFDDTVSRCLTWDDPDVLQKAQFRSLKVENLDVDTINGINVEDKLPKLSKTEDKEVYVVVEGNFQVPQLNATKVNGVNFQKYINQVFQINSTQIIRGEKIFKEMVTVTGNLKGMLNDYNITELERTALSKSKAQTITGTYTVEEFKANDVEAEWVDEVPTDQLLYQNNPSTQIINSDVVFAGHVAIARDIKVVNFMKGCDLTKVTQVDVESIANFQTLDVKGNVSWESDIGDFEGLAHFLKNVVTQSDDQVISGSVVFENDVVLRNVNGKPSFNNIDLEFMSKDAIYRSFREQEILTPVTFKGAVKVNSIEILNNVLIDSINGVDITDFEERLVRKSADVVVRGKKVFKKGFSANYFDAETVNGARTNKIIFYDDVESHEEIKFPPTIFKKLNVFNDLKVRKINDHILDEVFENRMSKTKNQIVMGKITVEGNVTIQGDGNIQRINDVNIEETILTNGEVSAKVITGDIEFRDAISIADKLEVDYINGYNLTELLGKALMVDDDAIIEGNVEFARDITINGNIDVNETINSCDVKTVTRMDFTDGPDKTNLLMRKSLREEVDELKNLTAVMKKPVIFMYMEKVAALDLLLPNIHGSAVNRYNDSVEFNIYGMNHGECGLPTECYCPTQTNLKIRSVEPSSMEMEANSTRFFKFYHEKLGVELKVTTNTVSYSSRCQRRDEEIVNESTSISWRKFEEGFQEVLTHKIFKGFLSDVKFFRLEDSVYVIMAFYFHPAKNQTYNLHTVVYELDVTDGTIKKVEEIPSSGAQVLEVFWTTRGIILVIGNSFDSDRYTDSVNSAIYRFNEYENKFELLRFVKTHGILFVKSMRYKKESFIFFVQKPTWPLLILKYNPDYDNYYFSQKLDTTQSLVRSNFLSVSIVSTTTAGYSGDLFVGIVLSDDSFRLFKYKHIEGFVEESFQEQNNVRILQTFWIKETQYVLAGSASGVSKIYKIVEQGR